MERWDKVKAEASPCPARYMRWVTAASSVNHPIFSKKNLCILLERWMLMWLDLCAWSCCIFGVFGASTSDLIQTWMSHQDLFWGKVTSRYNQVCVIEVYLNMLTSHSLPTNRLVTGRVTAWQTVNEDAQARQSGWLRTRLRLHFRLALLFFGQVLQFGLKDLMLQSPVMTTSAESANRRVHFHFLSNKTRVSCILRLGYLVLQRLFSQVFLLRLTSKSNGSLTHSGNKQRFSTAALVSSMWRQSRLVVYFQCHIVGPPTSSFFSVWCSSRIVLENRDASKKFQEINDFRGELLGWTLRHNWWQGLIFLSLCVTSRLERKPWPDTKWNLAMEPAKSHKQKKENSMFHKCPNNVIFFC